MDEAIKKKNFKEADALQKDVDGLEKKLEEEKELINSKIKSLLIDIADKQNIIDSLKNRKLTFKERLSGKIIMKDENK